MEMDERSQKIVELLTEQTPMKVKDIIEKIGDSPATIRRALVKMENSGIIMRERGFANLVAPDSIRDVKFSNATVAIAKCAAKLIEGVSIIMMDSGRTTLALAAQLVNKKSLTVVTNSISIANTFARTDVSVIVTGGSLVGNEYALVGPDAESYLNNVRVPLLFLSTTGVRGKEGLTCVTPFQASIKKAMIKAADKVVLLVEHNKLTTDALIMFTGFEKIDCIVTSAPIEDGPLNDRLNELGIEVILAV